MKRFLAIFLFCGISTVQSDVVVRLDRDPYRSRNADNAPRRVQPLISSSGERVDNGASGPAERDVPKPDVSDKNLDADTNFRLVKLLETVQDKLVFKEEDLKDPEKSLFSVYAFFLLSYFEADTGYFLLDFAEALQKVETAIVDLNKSPLVVAAPVRALFSKFVAALARRIGSVQEVCDRTEPRAILTSCKDRVKLLDRAANDLCFFYFLNANLHNCALNNVESGERVLRIFLDSAKRSSEVLASSLDSLKYLKTDLEALKSVYRLLTQHLYVCSYVNDVVPKQSNLKVDVRVEPFNG